jgi:hypothetical protein
MSARPKAPARLPGSVGDQAGSTDRKRLRVAVNDPDEDLADDPAADRTQLVAVVHDLGLLEDVEPQRRLADPPELGETDFGSAERADPEFLRDRLARPEPDRVTTLQIAGGERRVFGSGL